MGRLPVWRRWGELACVVVQELDLREGQGVIQGHKDCWLDQNVNHVHGCMAEEEGRGVQPCSNRSQSHFDTASAAQQDGI